MALVIGKKEKRLFGLVTAAFIFSVVVPSTLSDYALQYREEQLAERTAIETKIRELEGGLGSIEDKRAQVRRYISSYRQLLSRNVFDAPDKVSLVKEMRAIRDQRRQSAIDFSFKGTELINSDSLPTTEGSTIGVKVHPVELEMKMLHDLDLFMFMESLQGSVSTLSFPVRCSFKLLHNDFAIQNRENFDGSCQLNWYSVQDPDALVEEIEVVEEETVQG